MNPAVIVFVVACISLGSAQWNQGGGNNGRDQSWQRGQQRGGSGSWDGSTRSFQGQMSGFQRGQSTGRAFDGDTRYGANIIDTPTMIGYEATIPGATSRYVKFRNEETRGRSQNNFRGNDDRFGREEQSQFGGRSQRGQFGGYGVGPRDGNY